MFDKKLPICQRCPFYGHVMVPSEGPKNAKIALVADSPWKQEALYGRPMIGPSGRMLDICLEEVGIDRKDVFVTNSVRCLDGKTLIKTEDGNKRLNWIVKNKWNGKVLSVNERNELIYNRVEGWYRSDLNNRKLFRVRFLHGKKNPNGFANIVVTEGHKFLTKDGWLAVEDLLSFRDYVATGTPYAGKRSRQLIIGSILGDAHISKRGTFEEAHSPIQEEYLQLKLNLLSGFASEHYSNLQYGEAETNGKWFDRVILHLRSTPYFHYLRRKWYRNGYLDFPLDEIKKLSDFSLAIWYMDDGYFKREGNRFGYFEIAIGNLPEKTVRNIPTVFKDLGLNTHVKFSTTWRLIIEHDSKIDFLLKIAKFIPNCMRYKIPDEFHSIDFDKSFYEFENVLTFWDKIVVEEVLDVKKHMNGSVSVYCIDVKNTHNFITSSGGVVHNCVPDALGVPYPEGVVELCTKHFLKPELEYIKPEIVMPLGNNALKAMQSKDRGNISKVRGLKKEIDFFGSSIQIIPSYHPSAILRNPTLAMYLVEDLKQALGQVNKITHELRSYHVNTISRLERFWEKAWQSKILSWDIETTGLDYRSDDVLSINFSFSPYTSHVITFYEKYPEENKATLSRENIEKIYNLLHSGKRIFLHNGKFDLRMMHYQLFLKYIQKPLDIDKIKWYDTMGQHNLLDENLSQRLKNIAPMHTDLRYTREQVEDVKGGKAKKMALKDLVSYGSVDSAATRIIGLKFATEMMNKGLWYGPFVGEDYSDMSVANILYKMEIFGAPINKKKLLELRKFTENKLESLYGTMEEIAGEKFNPNSPDHMRDILYNNLDFEPSGVKTKKGKESTDKNAMALLLEQDPESEFLQCLKLYRQYGTIHKTFIKGIQQLIGPDGRLHPDFSFTRIVSGRIACYSPNLLNIPRDREFEEGILLSIREMFAARPGWVIIVSDFSQIEFKVAAFLSGDENMIEDIFHRGEDFHSLIARAFFPKYIEFEEKVKVFEKRCFPLSSGSYDDSLRKSYKNYESMKVWLKDWRTKAKNCNFGWLYGAEDDTLAATVNTTVTQIQKYTKRIGEKYPKFLKWLKETPEKCVELGEIRNNFGRIRHLPPSPDERVTSEMGRKGINFFPQGNAAYSMRAALVRMFKRYEKKGFEGRPFNVVYDQVISECPEEEADDFQYIMAEEMLRPVKQLGNHVFSIDIGKGDSWKSAETNGKKISSVKEL